MATQEYLPTIVMTVCALWEFGPALEMAAYGAVVGQQIGTVAALEINRKIINNKDH